MTANFISQLGSPGLARPCARIPLEVVTFTNQMRTLTKLIFCCRTFRALDRPLQTHRIWNYGVGGRDRHLAVAFGGRWVMWNFYYTVKHL